MTCCNVTAGNQSDARGNEKNANFSGCNPPVPSTPDDIARRLREVRQAAGLRQLDLAGRIGVDPSTVSLTESGARKPGQDVLLAWLDACGYDLEFRERARAGSRSSIEVDADVAEVAQAVEALVPSERATLARFVRAMGKAKTSRRETLAAFMRLVAQEDGE